MPPMPPPGGIAGIADFGSGFSATIASVVIKTGDRRRVLQRVPHDFRRIDDAGLDEVGDLALLGIVAVVDVLAVQELANDDRAVGAGVLGDLPSRPLEGLADDVDTDLLVRIGRGQLVERLDRVEQRDAATGDDTLFDRRTGRMHRVVNAVLAIFHLNLGRTANPDYRNAAGKLCEALLQLLAVIVGGGFLDLLPDLRAAAIDIGLLAAAIDDRRVFLLDADLLGLAEHVERDILELDAEILADDLTGCQDRDVLEHRLAAIAEARRLDRGHLETTAQLIDDERRERLALDVLGDDQQRPTALHDRFEQRQHRLQPREFLLVDQDIRVLELGDHLLGVRDEIRRDIAAVELHALDNVKLGLEALRLFDRDNALIADLLHRLGDHLANVALAIGGNRADLRDLLIGRDLLRAALEIADNGFNREVDAALQIHWVEPRGHCLGAFAHDRLGEQRGGGGAVARLFAGL